MTKRLLYTAPILYFLILPFVVFPGSSEPTELPKVFVLLATIFIYIGLYCLGIITHKLPFVKFTVTHYLIMCSISIFTISSIINGFSFQNLWGLYFRYQGIVVLLSYFLFFLICLTLQKIKEGGKLIGSVIALGGICVSTTILIQAVMINVFHYPIYTFNNRLTAMMGNPNFAAGFIALAASFIRYLPLKKTYPLVLLINFFALLLTGSRSGILAFLAVILLIVSENHKHKRILPIFLMGTIVVISLFTFFRPSSPFENRPRIWQKALLAVMDKPLLGWGLENFETAFKAQLNPEDYDLKNIRVDRAHNELLDTAVAGGGLALLVYLGLLIQSFLLLLKKKDNLWERTNLYGLIAYIIISQFNVLNVNEYLFFYLFLSTAASSERDYS